MADGKATPCAGYPSQKEAVEAFMAEGLERKAIVERTGLKLGRVDTLMSLNRKRIAARQAEAATWTPERLAKAQRLFGATMACIAEALDVPVADLIRKVAPWSPEALELLKAPPADEAAIDTDNEEQDLMELGAAAPETEPERPGLPADAHPAAPEPSREDDEAELAALEAAENTDPVANAGEGANGALAAASDDPASREADAVQHQALAASGFAGAAAGGGEVTPPPSAALTAPDGAPIFRLKRRGEYVDKSGVGSTRNLRHAWTGTARQIEAIYRRRPEFLEFDAEPVYA